MNRRSTKSSIADQLADVNKAHRRKNTTIVFKDDGSTATLDKHEAAKYVASEVRDRIKEDVHTIFDNYLLNHVPIELARVLKEAQITHTDGSPYLPHELILIWKNVVNEDSRPFANEKMTAVSKIESTLKEYLKKYVETIVASI